MAIPDGTTAPALNQLCRGIREYTLFQAVLQVIERLREAHPLLDEGALYDQLEFQANPGLGFAAHDIDRVEFFMEHGHLRARLRLNVLGLFGAGSPL
ncbi:MAG: type VI secretion system baseplate subunit TssG, partial [Pseudomonas paracarnis]